MCTVITFTVILFLFYKLNTREDKKLSISSLLTTGLGAFSLIIIFVIIASSCVALGFS